MSKVTLTSEQEATIREMYPRSIIIEARRVRDTSEIDVIVSPEGTYIGQEKVVRLQPDLQTTTPEDTSLTEGMV